MQVIKWNYWIMLDFIEYRYYKKVEFRKRDRTLFIYSVNVRGNGSCQFFTIWDTESKRQASLWEHEIHLDGTDTKIKWTVYDGNGNKAKEVRTFECEAEACKFFYGYIKDYFHVKRTLGDVIEVKIKRFFRIRFRRLKNLFRSGNV